MNVNDLTHLKKKLFMISFFSNSNACNAFVFARYLIHVLLTCLYLSISNTVLYVNRQVYLQLPIKHRCKTKPMSRHFLPLSIDKLSIGFMSYLFIESSGKNIKSNLV